MNVAIADGSLIVKILNRAVKITGSVADSALVSARLESNKKFALTPKNKVFVEQALREQKDAQSKSNAALSFFGHSTPLKPL